MQLNVCVPLSRTNSTFNIPGSDFSVHQQIINRTAQKLKKNNNNVHIQNFVYLLVCSSIKCVLLFIPMETHLFRITFERKFSTKHKKTQITIKRVAVDWIETKLAESTNNYETNEWRRENLANICNILRACENARGRYAKRDIRTERSMTTNRKQISNEHCTEYISIYWIDTESERERENFFIWIWTFSEIREHASEDCTQNKKCIGYGNLVYGPFHAYFLYRLKFSTIFRAHLNR